MSTILVPLDGSELAAQVLPWVRALASSLSARVQVLHVVSETQRKQFVAQHPDLFTTDSASGPVEHIDKHGPPDERVMGLLREYAEAHLAPMLEPLREAELEVAINVVYGAPAERILEAARQQVVLIAMVTHGYTGVRRWALGSVTDKVVHAARVPVFVLRGQKEAPHARHVQIQHILVPLDGSTFSRQALPVASKLALDAGADIHLVHVVPPLAEQPTLIRTTLPTDLLAQSQEATRAWSQEQLEEVSKTLREQGLRVSLSVPVGYVPDEIIETAEQQHSNLIVMATHGYSGVKRWSLGSVADKLLHIVNTPLLLVRASEK